jgi:AraC-like DNA-binding protein
MQLDNDFLLSLNLFSAFYYVALIVYFLIKSSSIAGRLSILGLLLVNICTLVNNSLILSGEIIHSPSFFWLGGIFISYFGVLVRLHIYTLLKLKIKFDWIYALTIAFNGLMIYRWIGFAQLSNTEQSDYFAGILSGNFPSDFAQVNTVFLLVMGIYFIETGIIVFRKPKNQDQAYRNLFSKSVKYVRNFWIMIIGIYVIVIIASLFLSEKIVEYAFIPIGMNVTYFYLVLHLKFYTESYGFETDDVLEEKSSTAFSAAKLEQIKKAVFDEKLYLNTNCSIELVAKTTGTSKNEVSRAINKGLNISFNDYVNSLRTEHAKNLLAEFDKNHDTVEGVGYAAGFNSKASFYRAFKKFTSQTPSSFIQ